MTRHSKQIIGLSRLVVEANRRSAQTHVGSGTGFHSRLHPSTFQIRAAANPAVELSDEDSQPSTSGQGSAPPIKVDQFGAVSVLSESDSHFKPNTYYNVDGQRFEDGRYAAFAREISSFVPVERQFTDPVRTYAYGTDASFYRLNPRMVVKVHSEAEVAKILPIAHKHQVPVTFRAAGTSLSGQALTDSVLLKLSHTGKNFRNYKIHGDGSEMTIEPGIIGGEVNRFLAEHKNTYHTVKDMRVVFLDGTILDTADENSRASFQQSHAPLLEGLSSLAQRIQADSNLAALIRRKFAIKCTTGYSLNALVDFPADDPIEILKHLIVGSEGTLGFVSEATYNTVPEWPHKASSFVMFPDVFTACKAAYILRNETAVDAVEMFDRASLKECAGLSEEMCKLVPGMKDADPLAAGLLIECRGQTVEDKEAMIADVIITLEQAGLPIGAKKAEPKDFNTYPFRHEAKDYNVYWDVRKGLIPIVGGARETGTSMLIEDVACPVENLGAMTMDLIEMFEKWGYKDASCFGHALEGNLHLVFSQGFRDNEEVARFGKLMDEMCYIVATKHSGSLKGEHGTGRNVAPYVEMEWGSKAYELMWEIKELFDPDYVLNPGVLLNRDPELHLKHLKQSPATHAIVDKCIECGFCESNCPSRDVTLTPRQRITVLREMARLKTIAEPTSQQQQRLEELSSGYEYLGENTCAADGMCQVKCPVGINTGEMVKTIREEKYDKGETGETRASRVAMSMGNNFGPLSAVVPWFLSGVSLAHRVVGPKPLEWVSGKLNGLTGNIIPAWNPWMPSGAKKLDLTPIKSQHPSEGIPRQVVYVPSCVTRMMGPALPEKDKTSVHDRLISLFKKADYEVIYPESLGSTCCGMLFNSRGFKAAAKAKGGELEDELVRVSQGGKIPIVCDTSPCLATIKDGLKDPSLKFALYEPVMFIDKFLRDKLEWNQVRDSVAIHVPCSSKKMGIEPAFTRIANLCSKEVTNTQVPCCGMAGDRGMRFPELTGAALQHMELPGCTDGYSSSKTCEMSLSNHSGIPFKGLVYLADEATRPKSGQNDKTHVPHGHQSGAEDKTHVPEGYLKSKSH
ncbi:hypothetical protein WJX73_004038 [Symbiochloris irregularis]|uniref:D-lactate dehydrogenase (cytochrome) n=1 Tax=Symbiochloris irregularis TaxID=706552 RepID=A0AAW1PBI3_9CHLO